METSYEIMFIYTLCDICTFKLKDHKVIDKAWGRGRSNKLLKCAVNALFQKPFICWDMFDNYFEIRAHRSLLNIS